MVRIMTVACVVLGMLASACGPNCEPGSVWIRRGRIATAGSSEPVEFGIFSGTCEPGHIPIPEARAVAEDGTSSRAQVTLLQLNGPTGAVPNEVVSANGTVSGFTRTAGDMVIEMRWGAAVRTLRLVNVEALDVPPDRVVPAQCHAPFRISSDGITCTAFIEKYSSETSAYEYKNGVATMIGRGSNLWRTRDGYLVTSDAGIGWLADTQWLSDWQAVSALPGPARGIASNRRNVFVLLDDRLLVLDRGDLTRVEQSISLEAPLTHVPPVIAASDSDVVVISLNNFNERSERRRETYVLGPGGWERRKVEHSRESAWAAWGDTFWTCEGVENRRMRFYRVTETGPQLVMEHEPLGACHAVFQSDVLAVVGAGFMQCPYFVGEELSFVSIRDRGLYGGCFDRYAHLALETPGGWETRIWDLTPYRR